MDNSLPNTPSPIFISFSPCADRRLLGDNLKECSACLYGTPWASCEDFKLFYV